MPDSKLTQSFVNSIPVAALCLDKDFIIRSCNGKFGKLYGSVTKITNTTRFEKIIFPVNTSENKPAVISDIKKALIKNNPDQQFVLRNNQQDLILIQTEFSEIQLDFIEGYYLLLIYPVSRHSKDLMFKLYKQMFNQFDRGLFIALFDNEDKGSHGNFIEVNDVACKQLGYNRDELLMMNARSLNPNSSLEAIKAVARNIKRDGETSFNAIHVSKDGQQNSVKVTAKLLIINNQSYVLSICEYQNLAYNRYEIEQSRFGRLLELSSEEIYVFSTSNLLIDQANTGALDNLGYSKNEIKQLKITDLLQDISTNTFQRLTKTLFEGKKSQIILESVFKRKDNTKYPVEIRIQLSHSEVPPVYLANIQDISDRKHAESNLLFMANHDTLTGLYNRNMFITKLNESIEQCNRSDSLMAVLFLDLDNFKHINDTMGHDTGDKLIQETALRLKSSVRGTDIVSRMGGDEFTAILTNLKQISDIVTVSDKIISNISSPFLINDFHIQTTCSLGITVYPFTEADNAYTLIKQADTAMYQAKALGKNRFSFYAATLAQEQINLKQMENDLKAAHKNNEFEVYFQAKVDLNNRAIHGAEALIRWTSTKYPSITPADFIPILEATNLIQDVDLWVFKYTCEQLKKWLLINPALVISVNLSAKHFSSDSLVEDINKILMETGVSAKNLEIEITEGVLISKTQKAETLLNQLKQLGFHISLDDFGSGYSSLSYLKQLPINRLKIDRVFVYDLENNNDSRTIITAIINLAESLGLSVIAEGIETEEQVTILKELECFEGQGYLFSKPCPAKDFYQLLKADL